MAERCGARMGLCRGVYRTGRCRMWPVPGKKRCWRHGGHSMFGRSFATGRKYEWEGRDRKQAVMRALGLPWYGGRRKTTPRLSMAEKAIKIMDEEIELLPVPRDVPDSEKGDIEIFSEGLRASVVLLRDVVRLGQRLIVDAEGNPLDTVAEMHPQDLKALGMASITALGVTKQGFKAADRQQRNDLIGKLLAAIAAEKEEDAK